MVRAKKAKKPKRPKRIQTPTGKDIKLKRTLFRRKIKEKEIEIVTRKEQPLPAHLKQMKVSALARQDIPLQRVSSSWIKELGYHKKEGFAVMTTLQGYGYYIYMPFGVFEAWYYAHSKGTYFNYQVKGKYTITRYR